MSTKAMAAFSGFGRLALVAGASVALVGCGDGAEDQATGSDGAGGASTATEPASSDSGSATTARERDHGDIIVEWDDTAAYAEARDAIEALGNLESLADGFNAALAFPRDLIVRHAECGILNALYNPQDTSVTMCYELVDLFWWQYDPNASESENDRVFVGKWAFVLVHELGHALIDLYDLPVLGREEDAADGLATLFLSEGQAADMAVAAALWWLQQPDDFGDIGTFADEHSLNRQRGLNVLCWVYGSDPVQFSNLGDLFETRNCEDEFADLSSSWEELLAPWSR